MNKCTWLFLLEAVGTDDSGTQTEQITDPRVGKRAAISALSSVTKQNRSLTCAVQVQFPFPPEGHYQFNLLQPNMGRHVTSFTIILISID